MGGSTDNMEIIRCGVNSNEPVRPLQSLKDRSSVKIGSLGRLVEKKGIKTLIEAGQFLKERAFEFTIEIAGDGPMRSELEKQAMESGLENNVRFIGAISHSDVAAWMKTLDVFAMPCQKDSNGDMDGIPVVLMEAMNIGIPVVSTWISGIPELIQHNQTGLMSKPGDVSIKPMVCHLKK